MKTTQELADVIAACGLEIAERAAEIAGDITDMESISVTISISPADVPDISWCKCIRPITSMKYVKD